MKRTLYILTVCMLVVSCLGFNETGPDEMTVPEVKSFTVDDNGGSLVFTLTSSVDKKVLGRINECGFYYGKDRDMSDAERVVCKVTGTEFSADIALHEYGETFYAASFVTSGAGTHEMTSEAKEMTLGELKDYVELETPDLLSYDRNSARVEVSFEAAEGVVVTEYGICYADFADPKLSDNSSEAVEGVVSVDGLEPGKAYHMCPYLKDGEHVVYGKSVPLAVYGLPVVVTAENPEKNTDSAVLCGEVQDDCGKKVTERGFLWRADAVQSLDPESDNKVKAGSGLGPFSATIEELEPNRNYSFCAYAVNEEGMAFGEVVRFTTGVAMPVHGLPEVVDITPFKAVFHGNVLSDGGETPSEFGFFWGSDKNVDKKIVCTGEDFMYKVEGLQRNTVYYVKSYSINSKGTAYSDLLEFRTLPELPEVSTGQVSGIFEYGAVCGGTIIDDGGAEILDKGICYSAGTEFSSATKISSGRGLAAFTCTVDGLDPNKTYYVCAYAENSAGISYGEQMSFTTETALAELSVTVVTDVTSSTAALRSSVLDEGGENPYKVGFYYSESENAEAAFSQKVICMLDDDSFCAVISGLTRSTRYYVRPYAVNSAGETVGETVVFTTLAEMPAVETAEVTQVKDITAVGGGTVLDDGGGEILAKGVVWDVEPDPTISLATKTDEGKGAGEFVSNISGLRFSTRYYVRAYVTNSAGTAYGQTREFVTMDKDLSAAGTANCYIVSESGLYRFHPVKGNGSESVGEIKSVSVLWESYGNSTLPKVGALVYDATYEEGYICFKVPEKYHTGNALIAAKDARGEILWSWHIWLTDMPDECVYANDAGILMDRNLGATSATAGDVGTWGLLYQWGRKDPFLGAVGNSSSYDMAQSTGEWTKNRVTTATADKGTIEYTIKHPTEFLYNLESSDWQWKTPSDKSRWSPDKTLYDPCPRGWRVPDSGIESPWYVAGFQLQDFNSAYYGMTFGTEMSSPATWYPVVAYIDFDGRSIWPGANPHAYYWTNIIREAFYFSEHDLEVGESYMSTTSVCEAHPVRCMKDM